jgi:Glycerophosphoryl diester phosphodiesterase family
LMEVFNLARQADHVRFNIETKLTPTSGADTPDPANQRDVTAASLAEAKALGVKVIPWTVNERSDMERLIEMGVAGIKPPARGDGGEGNPAAASRCDPLTRRTRDPVAD